MLKCLKRTLLWLVLLVIGLGAFHLWFMNHTEQELRAEHKQACLTLMAADQIGSPQGAKQELASYMLKGQAEDYDKAGLDPYRRYVYLTELEDIYRDCAGL
ncbi:hypothetical protein VST7929_00309 [Vibrio stylophorae]|uniref:Uncharacterized protein n=1 Tax=Vibrio stylophorae TaxID=659351 RepID=A0ABM8ZQD1_9VIBR|nr:hypothetical protein [Vibrio stylophorae]CAH0532479.1 hypothetical protein VST7929_00309 [Vibrio stylophorae]